MKKSTVAIIFGGISPEYSVSLESASAVITHLDPDKYNLVLVGITQQGTWLRFDGPLDNIKNDTWQNPKFCVPAILSPCRKTKGLLENHDGTLVTTPLDAAFPLFHGTFGEDGTIQGLIELAGIPIVGCTTLASALCMDKDRAHKLVEYAGVDVPKSAVFTRRDSAAQIQQAAGALGYPVFVKPVRAGSSYGITKVEDNDALQSAVKKAFQYDDTIVLEETIPGFEVGCAVLGNEVLTIGELDEVELTDGFFDFTEKYNPHTSKIHIPARITEEQATKVKEIVATIYRALDCSGFARVDMFLQPNGAVVFNEVNTIPGFTPHSRYPTMMEKAGYSFTEVLDTLIELAIKE